MTHPKRIVNLERQRRIPAHFSWIDHRLVSERCIDKADVTAWALYLFLVTVADAHGVSYYGNASLMRRLHITAEQLRRARADLIGLDLIAYDPPHYQVLSWPESISVAARFAQLHAILEGRA